MSRLAYVGKVTDFFDESNTKDKLFWLPSLHVVQALKNDLDIRAGIAKTVRRPSLRDLSPTIVTEDGTIAEPDTAGNPNVVPETAWGLCDRAYLPLNVCQVNLSVLKCSKYQKGAMCSFFYLNQRNFWRGVWKQYQADINHPHVE